MCNVSRSVISLAPIDVTLARLTVPVVAVLILFKFAAVTLPLSAALIVTV